VIVWAWWLVTSHNIRWELKTENCKIPGGKYLWYLEIASMKSEDNGRGV
jgi:hypothetical protein